MKNLKSISGNELSELIHMTNNIHHQVNNVFSHVSQHTPGLVKNIDKLFNDLVAEANRRENLL